MITTITQENSDTFIQKSLTALFHQIVEDKVSDKLNNFQFDKNILIWIFSWPTFCVCSVISVIFKSQIKGNILGLSLNWLFWKLIILYVVNAALVSTDKILSKTNYFYWKLLLVLL